LGERDETAAPVLDNDGNQMPDSDLRDFENVPLKDDIDDYFAREVLPHVPDAWMDRAKDKVGYEISFTRYFYEYAPLRSTEEIAAELLALDEETENLLLEVVKG
jgi:type I restriction enzyme M protein